MVTVFVQSVETREILHSKSKMSNDIQTFLLHFLNNEPFNLNMSPLQLDQLPPNELLQQLSNVLSWIFQIDKVDIRLEAPEDTAIRILNLLRILRYRPPVEADELEEWRAGIVEGSKGSLYPLLVFIFENSDALKERAYLAKFLMKTEVPSDVHDYDTAELQETISELMNYFKEIHTELKVIQSDALLLDDIKEDLKSMEKEQELLVRKIEKAEKKVSNIPYFERQMQLAAHLRGERDRIADYTLQKHQERQKVFIAENRLNRLEGILTEMNENQSELDQNEVMEKLENEMKTNKYLVEEKLAVDIKTREQRINELSHISRSASIKENEISKMGIQVDEIARRIKQMEEERDNKEEDTDENMSIFRHQVTALERKKESAVQKLQVIRQELSKVENDVELRKTQLQHQLGGQVLSAVQYKKYLEQFRVKNDEHKKKRKELDDLYTEKGILKRSVEILNNRYEELESHIESIGGEVVEVLNVPQRNERPKTAAPETNDVETVKSEMREMMEKLDEKKDKITNMRLKRDELKKIIKDKGNKIHELKEEKNTMEMEMERRNQLALSRVKELEEKMKELEDKRLRLKQQISELLEDKNTLDKFSVGGNDNFDELEAKLNKETEKEKTMDLEISEMGSLEAIRTQAELWKNLLALFQIKIEVLNEKLNSQN